MAEVVQPELYIHVLLVEGAEDFDFFLALLKELGLEKTFFVYKYCGRDNLAQGLSIALQDTRFEDLRHLVIIRDADFNTDAISSIRSAIDLFNKETGSELSMPVRQMEPEGDAPEVSAIILPDENTEGMLEDLVLEALSEDIVYDCINDYFNCLEDRGLTFNKYVLSKAKVRVFIAGKVVDDAGTSKDRGSWEMRYAVRSNWWSWDSPAFNDVKAYLRQLAS